MNARMRAAYIEKPGPASEIFIGSLPIPDLGPTDVLVQPSYVAVNHVDTFVRSGAFSTPIPFPFVIGRDVVGRVVAIGNGVSRFTQGEIVWANSLGYAGLQGPTAEYCCVPQDRLWHLPPDTNPVTAVAALHPLATAFVGLHLKARIENFETVFVGGGAGAVGSAVIQLAKARGATVVTSCRRKDTDLCLELGADAVVDFEDDNWPRLAASYGRAFDLYWDNSGTTDFDAISTLLAPKSRVVIMAGLRNRPVFPQGAYYMRDISLLGFALSNALASELGEAARNINSMFEKDLIKMRVAEVLPLEKAREAHELLESTKAGKHLNGRIVLSVSGNDPV